MTTEVSTGIYFRGTLEEAPNWERSQATCTNDTNPKAADSFEKEYVLKLGNPLVVTSLIPLDST